MTATLLGHPLLPLLLACVLVPVTVWLMVTYYRAALAPHDVEWSEDDAS